MLRPERLPANGQRSPKKGLRIAKPALAEIGRAQIIPSRTDIMMLWAERLLPYPNYFHPYQLGLIMSRSRQWSRVPKRLPQ
jgi:hypothetical protein